MMLVNPAADYRIILSLPGNITFKPDIIIFLQLQNDACERSDFSKSCGMFSKLGISLLELFEVIVLILPYLSLLTFLDFVLGAIVVMYVPVTLKY